MEIRILRYFLTVAREEKYYQSSQCFTYYTTDIVKTINAAGRRIKYAIINQR